MREHAEEVKAHTARIEERSRTFEAQMKSWDAVVRSSADLKAQAKLMRDGAVDLKTNFDKMHTNFTKALEFGFDSSSSYLPCSQNNC